MKLEVEFNETDSEGAVMTSCLIQYRNLIQNYEDSKKRYTDIVKIWLPQAYKKGFDKEVAEYHAECDQIEQDWKRMGVRF